MRSQKVERKNDYEFDEEAVIIPGEGGIGDIFHYANGKYALHQRTYTSKREAIPQRFTRTALISIPPLDEQHRMASILYRSEALCNDLTQGIPAEIEARRKQYAYYRDKLLTFTPLTH